MEIRIFISSVMDGLEAERATARSQIGSIPGLVPVMFEDFGAKPSGPREAYLQHVRDSRIVVAIIGEKYSPKVDEELQEALLTRKDLLVFVKDVPLGSESGKLVERLKATNRVTYARFDTEARFSELLRMSLGSLIAERFASKETLEALSLPELVTSCQKRMEGSLRELKGGLEEKGRKKYIPGLYAARKEVDAVYERFLTAHRQALMIVGPAGIGKTNLLCHLAEATLERGMPCVFLSAAYVWEPLEESIVKSLTPSVPKNASLAEVFDRFRRILGDTGKSFVIFIDAVNEAPNPRQLKVDLANLSLKLGKEIRLVASCRDIDWNFFATSNERLLDTLYEQRPGESVSTLGVFSDEELGAAWRAYSQAFGLKGSISSQVLEICRHPLMLRFLAEGFQGEQVPSDVKRREIFDRFWARKLKETGIADLARDRMFKIVREMVTQNVAELPLTRVVSLLGESATDLSSSLSRLLSEGLVIYVRLDPIHDYMVGFSYEAFFEYVVALYYLQVEWVQYDDTELLAGFKHLTIKALSSRIIRGSLEFLILFAEERSPLHIDLVLSLDGQRSDIETVACNALSKLERVDNEALECLKTFARSESVETAMFAREVFIQAHYRIPDPVALLRDWGRDYDPEVRTVCAATLSRAEAVNVNLRLNIARRLIVDKSEWVRSHAIASIADMVQEYPAEGLGAFRTWRQADVSKVDQAILRALSYTDSGRLSIDFFKIVSGIHARRKRRMSSAVASAIGRIGMLAPNPSLAILEEVLGYDEFSSAMAVVSALEDIGAENPKRATELLSTARDMLVRLMGEDRYLRYPSPFEVKRRVAWAANAIQWRARQRKKPVSGAVKRSLEALAKVEEHT